MPEKTDTELLAEIRQAVREYHFALDSREHGVVAMDRAIDSIQTSLGMHWERGKETDRRDSYGSAHRALADQSGSDPEDWEEMEGPEAGVGVERWFVHKKDGREAYTVDDQGHITIEINEKE